MNAWQLIIPHIDMNALKNILADSGHVCDDIESCKFRRINSTGSAVFEIVYFDITAGESTNGFVYVDIANDGQLTADF